MKYFIYEPDNGATIFVEEAKWKEAIDNFDFLGKYCDDGWSMEVENVIAGILPDYVEWPGEDAPDDQYIEECCFYEKYKTQEATKFDEQQRPEEVNEEGYSLDGTFWGDWDYRCRYAFAQSSKQAGC